MSQSRPLLLVVLLMAFAVLPGMAAIGMFFDGAIYASISRNLAEGRGTLWDPSFSQTLFASFREHPPLMFWLQSVFFGVLGDSYLTERLYDLVLLVTSLLVLWRIWATLLRHVGAERLVGYFWLVIVCLAVTPKWAWAYRNNVLENTLTLFSLIAVWLILLASLRNSFRAGSLFTIGAAVCCFLALLTKGLVGLFVLAVPALCWIVFRVDWRRISLIYAVLLPSMAALWLGLLYAMPEAVQYFSQYIERQLVSRVGAGGEGLRLIPKLLQELLPMLAVLFIAAAAYRKKIVFRLAPWSRASVLALFIGLSASLPLVLGDMVSSHYLLPSIPFYALAVAIVIAGLVDAANQGTPLVLRAKPGWRFAVAYGALCFVLGIWLATQVGQVRKNGEHYEFLGRVCKHLDGCAGKVVFAEEGLWRDWRMHAIGQRHFRLSLDNEPAGHGHAIGRAHAPAPSGFTRSVFQSGSWVLYRSARGRKPASPLERN